MHRNPTCRPRESGGLGAARKFWVSAFAGTIACALLLLAGPVLAQDTRELMNRIDRLQRELSTLQQDYYRNRGVAPSGATVGSAASFEVRLSQIESQLQSLTGRAEELSHATDLIKDRLDKLVSDVDSRLLALEQQRGGSAQAAPAQQPQQASAPPTSAAPAPRGQAPSQPAQPGRGAPPGNLGTLTPDAAAAIRPPLPDGNAKQQYDYATALITKDQNFPEAERSLKAFIAAYPTDALTPNAYYWLGETYYVRKDYQQAAFTFAEAFQKYPKAQKAPDSLFKLGLSLSQLNQTKEACTAYGRLLDNFPTADNALKARVSNEQRRLKCV